jgi:hypothetical protein
MKSVVVSVRYECLKKGEQTYDIVNIDGRVTRKAELL